MQAKAESRERQATDSLKNDIWDRIESKTGFQYGERRSTEMIAQAVVSFFM
ncbi:hypothetical protein MSB04_11350 [bacterium]|nr:hypothetical protein [bacterium]MCI7170996.1 hypothetical protein [bacterium]